jgi:hypothetical protein
MPNAARQMQLELCPANVTDICTGQESRKVQLNHHMLMLLSSDPSLKRFTRTACDSAAAHRLLTLS